MHLKVSLFFVARSRTKHGDCFCFLNIIHSLSIRSMNILRGLGLLCPWGEKNTEQMDVVGSKVKMKRLLQALDLIRSPCIYVWFLIVSLSRPTLSIHSMECQCYPPFYPYWFLVLSSNRITPGSPVCYVLSRQGDVWDLAR